jgi:hypothetical protein
MLLTSNFSLRFWLTAQVDWRVETCRWAVPCQLSTSGIIPAALPAPVAVRLESLTFSACRRISG